MKREERQTPPQLKGFRVAKRKSKTSRKREHFWTPEEHRVFLQYCEGVRLTCFHAIHRDTGGRPSELLALKISDLKIQTSPSTGKKYAEFWIGDKVGGKMRKARPAAISDAIPYYNAGLSVHPRRDSPQGAYLFTSTENKAKYCPICHESNKQDAAFCFKCNWVISKKGVQEVREKDEAAARKTNEKEKELEQMRQDQKRMWNNMEQMQDIIDSLWKQTYRAEHGAAGEGGKKQRDKSSSSIDENSNNNSSDYDPRNRNIIIGLPRQKQEKK
jgi:hypothetical protein